MCSTIPLGYYSVGDEMASKNSKRREWTKTDIRELKTLARAKTPAGSRHFLGAPFGDYKSSGVGREECLEELLAFTQEKNINIKVVTNLSGSTPRRRIAPKHHLS